MTKRLGVLPDGRMPINDIVECAKLAEECGLESVWTSDFTPRETWVPATACASATKRISVGTCISSFPVRHPLVTAGLTMNLDELSGKRTILGLGTGAGWLAKVGIKLERPRSMMREYIEILRAIFSGTGFPFHGDYYSIEDWAWWKTSGYKAPRADVPIYAAAVAPRMIELAGEVADGVILGSVKNLAYTKLAKDHLEEGARRAKRSSVDFGTLLLTFVGKDSKAAKKTARARLSEYASRPAYKDILEKMGYGKEREEIVRARAAGDLSSSVNAVSDRMVEEITLAGTAEECRAKLDEYRREGVTLPILYVIQTEEGNARAAYAPAIEGLSQ